MVQKAADGNVAVAKHNLALLLRDGKGAPRDGKKAIELLRSAARQGMTGSMFLLGDIYERGDAASRDAPLALAWFAVTAEFERQVNHAQETPLAKTAQQKVETLHRVLTPAELERAEKIGQAEFQQILAAFARRGRASAGRSPPRPAAGTRGTAGAADRATRTTARRRSGYWLAQGADRTRPDGPAGADPSCGASTARPTVSAGPATRAAIIDFEKSVGLRETGEASREVYVAALGAIAQHDAVARSPLPPPPRSMPPKAETPAPKLPKAEAPAPPPRVDLGRTEPPPPPPTSADIAKGAVKLAPALIRRKSNRHPVGHRSRQA